MPSNATAKTKWAPKKREIVVILLASIILAASLWLVRQPSERTLHIGDYRYSLEIVDTESKRTKGLSGRESLPNNQAMLFVFQQEEQQCFWMKDMNFPIDIVWTNARRTIVHIEQHISPQSYPRTYCSGKPAMYVFEFVAGEVAKMGLHKGQTIQF